MYCIEQGTWDSQAAQWSRTHLQMQETQEMRVRSPSWEDPLEKGIATHYSIPAWRTPWTELPGGLWSMGPRRIGLNWATEHMHTQSKANRRWTAGTDGSTKSCFSHKGTELAPHITDTQQVLCKWPHTYLSLKWSLVTEIMTDILQRRNMKCWKVKWFFSRKINCM